MIREFTVKYELSDEQLVKEIEKVTEEINKKHNKTYTPEEFFESMMTYGCLHDIKNKLEFFHTILHNDIKNNKK